MYILQLLVTILMVVGNFSYSIHVNHIVFPEASFNYVTENKTHHPDYGLNISQFLEKHGYPLETHEVTTEDGYILTLHRIPYGKNELALDRENKNKPAILVMHPLLSSSIDMVNLGPNKSIGLLLADEGYDVWLGNIRGNTWSRRHVSLDPDFNKTFWDFSFDECGFYDIPAKIDYILKTTGHDKLSYLGHSQGTTAFFAMATLKPEYNEKINTMIAFAPVAYMQNVTQPVIRFLADYLFILDPLTTILNINELLPHSQLFPDLVKVMCCDGCDLQEVCVDFISFLVGSDPSHLDRSFIEVIGSNAPSGASTKMFKHFGQEINSGHFRRYDYGTLQNLLKYQKDTPPDYDLSLINTPVALYYGGNDAISAAVNVEQFVQELPNVVEARYIDYFNHLDFIWAKDADTILYRDVIKLLNGYNNK